MSALLFFLNQGVHNRQLSGLGFGRSATQQRGVLTKNDQHHQALTNLCRGQVLCASCMTLYTCVFYH